MPITKSAFEEKSDVDNASYFNSYLNKSLKNNPIPNINLKLEGFAENAKLALTYGFSAEFDFGTFKDDEVNKTAYLMYSFGHSLLYNVYDRLIISSVPVRAISTNLISFEEEKKYPDMKSELMKRAFYNSSNPQSTMLEQFRIMLKKQSFKKKVWEGKKPRVVMVNIPKDIDNLFKNFNITKNQFLEFLGQASTFAFGYKLESPILPFMMNAALTSTTISRFDFATKLYNKIDLKLQILILKSKYFIKDGNLLKKVIKKMQNLLKVNLGMAIEIEIFDTFEDKVIYKQYFFAEKTYIENKNKIMRSDAANVCELTEAVLERAFISIKNKDYRSKIINGETIQSQYTSALFQLDTDNPEEVDKQSEFVLNQLPKIDTF